MKYTSVSLLLISMFALICSACSGPKDPTFQNFENISVKSISLGEVSIAADMVLNNPNGFTCHLKDMYLEIFSETDVKLTEIKQTYNTEMLANSDFKLPVVVGFAPDKLIGDKGGLLGSVLMALGDKEVLLKYKGYCTVEVLEINMQVPIDYEESILLKK